MKDSRFFVSVGGKYVADEFHEGVGGNAANVAIGCSNHNLNTAILAKIGENVFKQVILQKLVKKTVSTEFLQYEKSFLNISTILLSPKGEKTVIHYATPNESFNLSSVLTKNLSNSSAVFMGNLPDISIEERAKLLSTIREEGKTVFLNLGIQDCRKKIIEVKPLLSNSDVLFLNTHEFAELIKIDLKKINFEKDCSPSINFEEKLLVLTDGENGSFGYCGGKVYRQEAIPSKHIVDATGAGDAYTAGFIASYLNGGKIGEAMLSGSQDAKNILEKIGAN